MKSNQIRQAFLDYFAKNGHKVVASSPVIPADDPTLLFTNAGMVQFKNTFLGLEKRDYRRATTSQKCIRAGGKHNDLDQVGFTARHQTFFEMLGNFSFGDYFKEDAIHFAWEFVTKILRLDPSRLYATVYKDDDDAERLWKKIAPELKDRVLRFGEKDNFWSMGETGPCGPCSEIHYDRGPQIFGELNGEGDRFMEVWNLVFMQYNRDDKGVMTPLPKPSVDTGAGLERFCMVLQNVDSNYGTDLFEPLVAKVGELSGHPYKLGPEGVAHRVIADHVRALSFAIADNAIISNEGRGYVLRRILRRAARYGHELGLNEPFIYKLVPTLVEKMGGVYPEIKAHRSKIELVIKSEEEQFDRTLENGIARFAEIVAKMSSGSGKTIPGAEVFKLYDTYGFPADLTEIMAKEKGLAIDWAGFEKELKEQRGRSRQGSSFVSAVATDAKALPKTEFTYDDIKLETEAIFGDKINDSQYMVLNRTPFYAESGGQVGDTGKIFSGSFEFIVENTKKMGEGIVHIGHFSKPDNSLFDNLRNGQTVAVSAQIDTDRRADIQRNHTATHLLHKALRIVLGDHVYQSGSLVAPDRLRFDFSHFKAMTPDEIDQVESIVNEKIAADMPVKWENKTMDEAKQMGAMALFGEKYGDTVRVVQSGDFSMELCGGTHVKNTGDIGRFFITSESAIAAGVRRIEAITGCEASKVVAEYESLKNKLEYLLEKPADKLDNESIAFLKTSQNSMTMRLLEKDGLAGKLEQMLTSLTKHEKEKSKSELQAIQTQATRIAPIFDVQVDSHNLKTFLLEIGGPNEFMPYFDGLKSAFANCAIIAIARNTGQFAINSPDINFANKLKDDLVQLVGAKGGGKPTIRGSMPADKVDQAIDGLRAKYAK
jgi:alanyl-tRNA synthetase